MKAFSKNDYTTEIVLVCVSLVFLVLNLLTLSWDTIPWLDEIMMTDTAVNFHLDGKWITTAWYDGGEQSPFSTYPPLYQFLLVLWMKLFGFSQFAVKSLNIFITFGVSLLGVSFVRKLKPQQTKLDLIVFIVLFWTAGVFTTIYRFGRVDVLNIFCSLLFLKTAIDYVQYKQKPYLLLGSSLFVLFSGIQACVFVVLALLWSFIFYSRYRKKILSISLYFSLGSVITMTFLFAFFYYHNHLFAFLVSLVSYSSSLKRLALLFLPIIGPWFNFDVASIISKVAPDADAPSFTEELISNYGRNPDYLIIMALSIILLVYLKISKYTLKKETLVLPGFSLAIPLFMSLAGRYVIYYTWMGYLPALFSFILLAESIPLKRLKVGVHILTITLIAWIGWPKKMSNASFKNTAQIEEFIQKQGFDHKDCIVAPFSVYFPLREVSRNSYFIGIYPLEYIPMKVNYLISDSIDYDDRLATYKTQAIQAGKTLTLIDHSGVLNLNIYRIE